MYVVGVCGRADFDGKVFKDVSDSPITLDANLLPITAEHHDNGQDTKSTGEPDAAAIERVVQGLGSVAFDSQDSI